MVDKDGTMLPCCAYTRQPNENFSSVDNIVHWWTDELKDIRKNLSTSIPHAGCTNCYEQEANPHILSLRQYTNINYTKQLPSFDEYYQGDLNQIDSLEIRLSNYCNLRCLMCGPYASSSIAQELAEHRNEFSQFGFGLNSTTVRWWDGIESNTDFLKVLGNVSSVHFSGGEPLIVPEIITMLSALDTDKLKLLHITTNLTKLNPKLLEVLKKFRQIDITVSLEGCREHNDYIRYGSSWAEIDQNLQILLSMPNVKITVNHVLQHTSVFALPNLIDYCESHNLNMSFIEVIFDSLPSPGVLTLSSASQHDVDKFCLWLDSYTGPHKELLTSWTSRYTANDWLLEKFQRYIQVIDRVRKVNFRQTFNPSWTN